MDHSFYQKQDIHRDPEEDRLSREKIDKYIFYVLLTVIAIVPLLVGGHAVEVISPFISELSGLSTGIKGDLFTFYKFAVLASLTLLAVGMFLFKLFFLDYRLPKKPILWFFFIFILSILISTVFAPYKSVALFGQYNRTDGALSYLSYTLLMFVAMHINYPAKTVRYILFALYPLTLINIILITMNFYGHDALTYPAVQKIITLTLPEGAQLGENSMLLGTLNQWNYMSGMFSIVTIMFLAGAVFEKNRVVKFSHFIAAFTAASIMLMSVSKSGFLTFILTTLLLIMLIMRKEKRKLALLTLIMFFICIAPVFHILASKNSVIWEESIGTFVKVNPYTAEEASLEKDSLDFSVTQHKVFAAENAFKLPELPESNISAGSGRSYIWKKSLELLEERPLIGYGLDTIVYHFPHYDIEARTGMGNEKVLVDKPHSMYVGVAYGTGLLGIIGFAGIVMFSFYQIIFFFWRSSKEVSITAVLGLAWIAFLIQALFNDSLPGTAAPLLTIAGIAIALINKESTHGRNI